MVLSAFGVVGLGATLLLNVEAWRQAREANEIARQERRPWLSVTDFQLVMHEAQHASDEQMPKFLQVGYRFNILNTGGSPAINVRPGETLGFWPSRPRGGEDIVERAKRDGGHWHDTGLIVPPGKPILRETPHVTVNISPMPTDAHVDSVVLLFVVHLRYGMTGSVEEFSTTFAQMVHPHAPLVVGLDSVGPTLPLVYRDVGRFNSVT
jgi:hypothetical protein